MRKTRGRPKTSTTAAQANQKKPVTSITFTSDDLQALARYTAVGTIVLQTRHSVVSKLKAAFTRLGLSKPAGL